MAFMRNPAVKMRTVDILNSQVWSENNQTVIVYGNKKIYRVNIIGAIVVKEESSNSEYVIIDDSTGRIEIRNFNEKKLFSNINLGEIVNVIGRIGEFKSLPYIIPEIVSKTTNHWLRYRLAEILSKQIHTQQEENIVKETQSIKAGENEIIDFIRKNDSGDGVNIMDIFSAKIDNAEEKVNALKSAGYIFEIKPGIYKILE